MQFLLDNWQFISAALVILFTIIGYFIKRKPKKYDQFVDAVQAIMIKIPGFIYDVEQENPDVAGSQKKEYVLNIALKCIEDYMLKRELTEKEFDYFYKTISWFVEKVMLAPTKKGGLGREEIK